MKQTTNYLMHLPEVSDYADIGVLNENTVKIDGELKKAETHRGEGASHVTPAEKESWSGKADKKHSHTKSDVTDFAHSHSAGDITAGTLSIARGGTGAGTAAAARGNLDIWGKGECLSGDTAALLGLPSTATPNDALNALGLEVATTSASTVFGQEGYLAGGRFRDVKSSEGNRLQIGGTDGQISFIIYAGTPNEYVIIYVTHPEKYAHLQRVKWVSAERSFHLMGNNFTIYGIYNHQSKVCILPTEDANEFVTMLNLETSPNRRVLLQKVRWTGAAFENVGSCFDAFADGDMPDIVSDGITNEYIVSARVNTNGGQGLLQRVRWDGSNFRKLGAAFVVSSIAPGWLSLTLASTGIVGEILVTNSRGAYDNYLQRMRWTGTAFETVGNELKINGGYYSVIATDIPSEYVLCIGKDGSSNSFSIKRLRLEGTQLNSVGYDFNVYSGSANYSTAVNASEMNELIVVIGDSGVCGLQRVQWTGTAFENKQALFMVKDENGNNASAFEPKIIKSETSREYIVCCSASGIKVQRVFSAYPNATALQTRKPTQKCVVIKQ